jgi:hypothetical protein
MTVCFHLLTFRFHIHWCDAVHISGKTITRDSDGPLELVSVAKKVAFSLINYMLLCFFEKNYLNYVASANFRRKIPENILLWDGKQVIEDEGRTLGGGGQLNGSPWKGGFTLANESVSDNIENTNNGNKKSCTVQKLHQFESFYERLTFIAREYFFPPEIVRFGLITERSLLPSLDVVNEVNPETWFLAIHYLGCTTCSVVVKEGDDLRNLLHCHDLNIKEVVEYCLNALHK